MTAPGIHAVLYAFFDRDEALDRERMRRQVDAVIDAGVAGVNVLGLATEVTKLSLDERRRLIEWTAQDVAGRVPFSVTINGPSVAEQTEQLRIAEAAGAAWLVLQPPVVGNFPASEYLDFFTRVAAAATRPAAIQNAPGYFGRGLTDAEIAQLFERAPQLEAIKAEGPAIDVAALRHRLPPSIALFNGRGGLEMVDCLRAGCAGLVLAPDLVDHAVAIHRDWSAGDEAAAERRYGAVAPAIIFIMQSLETLAVYGKRIFAARAGLGEVHDRRPAAPVGDFGMEIAGRLTHAAGAFGRQA